MFVGLIAIILLSIAGLARLKQARQEAASSDSCNDYRWWPEQLAPDRWAANIFQNGLEVFFPVPPHANPVYEITVTGIVGYNDWHGGSRHADASYETDSQGNFTRWHDDLLFNRRPFQSHAITMMESDRALHRYRFQIDGPPERLTVSITKRDEKSSAGSLHVEVALLPSGTARIGETRRLATEEYTRKQQELDAKQKRSEAAARLAEEIRAICVQSEVFRNWSNPDFRQRFARTYKDDLLKNQAEIRDNAVAFLLRHDIVSYLRRHHPEVLSRQLGKVEALLIAEDLAADKRPQVTTRRRPSVGEVRDRMRRRIEVSAGDRKAILNTVLQQKQEMLKDLDEYDLSDDERESYITEVEEWAAGELVRLSEGKGPNETHQTIG